MKNYQVYCGQVIPQSKKPLVTPHFLVYRSEMVLPMEIGILSKIITYYSHSENDKEKRVNLDLLP